MKRALFILPLFLLGPLRPAAAVNPVNTGAPNAYMVENTSGTNNCYFFQTTPTCSATITGLSSSTLSGAILNQSTLQAGATAFPDFIYVGHGIITDGSIGAQALFRTDAGLEVENSTKPIISLFNTTNPLTISKEAAITFGGYTSLGNAHQTSSISATFGTNTDATSDGVLRLDPKFNSELSSQDMQLFGRTGIQIFGPASQTAGPGSGTVEEISNGTVVAGTLNSTFIVISSTQNAGQQFGFDSSTNAGLEFCEGSSCSLEWGTNNGSTLANRMTLTAAGNLQFADTTKGIVGTTTNDNATAGDYGEYVSSVTATDSFALSNNTWADCATITLGAGDWNLTGQVEFDGASPIATQLLMGISSTSGNSATGLVLGDNEMSAFINTAATDSGATVSAWRRSISGSTQFFLKGKANFSGGTEFCFGRLSARRVR
jgi:hypothetical protein